MKKWYKIFGDGPTEKHILLANVCSKGNAFIIAELLSKTYKNVIIK